MSGLRIPGSTYRLQMGAGFDFARARAVVAYLNSLGITDLYSSPLTKPVYGSSHGYDVADPTRLNPQLGGEEDFLGLVEELRRNGMGLLLDIVPNHMAADVQNPWWYRVLRDGPESPYSSYFDLEWWPVGRPWLAGRLLLPILGRLFGEALEDGEIALELGEDGFCVRYFDHRLPVSLDSYGRILAPVLQSLGNGSGTDDPAIPQCSRLVHLLEEQEVPETADEEQREARFAEITSELRRLYSTCTEFKMRMDEKLRYLNGKRSDPRSFGALEELLEEQSYRLAFWPLANQEINYRRFFDVSGMVSVRVEKQDVFDATHSLILKLARSGKITGLRIDHIDGLYDPKQYLCRLQERLSSGEAGVVPAGPGERFYIVVEKILSGDEELPGDWPVSGTTGYDFMRLVNGLFVDRSVESGESVEFGDSFDEVVYRRKRQVMAELFAGEMRSLVLRLERIAKRDLYGRDIGLPELERALTEITACFPVYRTYIRSFEAESRDQRRIARAFENAVSRDPGNRRACEFCRRVLSMEFAPGMAPEERQAWLSFVMRWQQFTGPIMAKGFEDTALYVYNSLVSANEVGGDPGNPAIHVEEFHSCNRVRRERWPHSMNATSTHDTKRSEDVRARINVLSEIPGLWHERLEAWRRWNRGKKRIVGGRPVPEGSAEILLYQTLLGAWPLEEREIPEFKKRLEDYLVKASREAKTFTSWLNPDPDYEGALVDFAASLLETGDRNPFYEDFLQFQRLIAYYGALNALSQTLLKVCCPGVPDFYQGTELWSLSLVDPDNRRPVNFELRAELLAELREKERRDSPGLLRELVAFWKDGRIKLYLIHKALGFRNANRELFDSGEYLPLKVEGALAEHACAFARCCERSWVLVVAPRFLARLLLETGMPPEPPRNLLGAFLDNGAWEETHLILPERAPGLWTNVLTGKTEDSISPAGQNVLSLRKAFTDFPVGLLASGDRRML